VDERKRLAARADGVAGTAADVPAVTINSTWTAPSNVLSSASAACGLPDESVARSRRDNVPRSMQGQRTLHLLNLVNFERLVFGADDRQ
jgi:hypothetical protein